MLNQDYTAKLLILKDAIVTDAENNSDELHVCLELPRAKHRCPDCGALTDRIHDYRMQTIKDVPMGRATLLHLRKRRYRCACGKRFFEKNTFLLRYHRVTSRLVATIITAFRTRCPLPGSGRVIMCPARLPCATSSASAPASQSFRKSFLWTSSRETPAVRSITALS